MSQKVSLARRRLAAVPLTSEAPVQSPVAFTRPSPQPVSEAKDFFVERDGIRYAGTHVLVDFWGASRLDDRDHIENALRDAVKAAGATLLYIHLHKFSPNGGVSGVAVISESHISVHTWPERGYAAFDVFTCGNCDPYQAVKVLRNAFTPNHVQLAEQKRGLEG